MTNSLFKSKSYTLLNNTKNIFNILGKNEKKKSYGLFFLICTTAIFETLGILSIVPFLSVISNDSIFETNKFLSQFYNNFSFENREQFLIVIGLISIFIFTIYIILKLLSEHALINFTYSINSSLSTRLMKYYLERDYNFFIKRHSSSLINSIINEVIFISRNIILQILKLTSSLIVSFLLISTIIITTKLVGLLVFLIFLLFYFLIDKISKRKVTLFGDLRTKNLKQRFKEASQTIANVKNIKLMKLESKKVEKFKLLSEDLKYFMVRYNLYRNIPKYSLQWLVFISLFGFLVIFIYLNDLKKTQELIPTIILLTIVISRIQNIFSEIYASISNIRFSSSALKYSFYFLKKQNIEDNQNTKSGKRILQKVKFKDSIIFDNVSFEYDSSRDFSIKNLDISIRQGSKNLILGKNGSGKSTFMDIVTGLLLPTKGNLLIDGKKLSKLNINQWFYKIGYVSQDVILDDESIRDNIVVNLSIEKYNHRKMIEVSKISLLHDFVEEKLEEKYDTVVGENGVKLSGGQKQRIAIARSLYNDPEVLVFDEATSSLDYRTEVKLIKNLLALKNNTLIFSSHKTSYIDLFDNIIIFENGKIVESGSAKKIKKKFREFIL